MCTLFVQIGETGLLLASLRGHTDVVATLLSAPGVLVDLADNEVCVRLQLSMLVNDYFRICNVFPPLRFGFHVLLSESTVVLSM